MRNQYRKSEVEKVQAFLHFGVEVGQLKKTTRERRVVEAQAEQL